MKQKKNNQQPKSAASKKSQFSAKPVVKAKTATLDLESGKPTHIIAQPKQKLNIDKFLFRLAIGLIVVLAVAVYGQTLGYGLVNCDDNGIFSNFSYYEKLSNISKAFFEGYYGSQYFRPMVTSSFIVDAAIGGSEHWINHLTNLFLHIVTSIGVLFLLAKMNFKKDFAVVASLLFTVHPLFVNAVGWLNGRNDLLVGVFAVWSFYFFLKSRKTDFWLNIGISALLYLLSDFSKEVGLVLPVVAFCWIYLVEKDSIFAKKNLITYALFTLALAIWIYMRTVADIGVPMEVSGLNPLIANLQQIPEYISKFFLPYNITAIPAYETGVLIIGSLAIVLIIIVSILSKGKNLRLILFGALWLLVFLIPGMFKRMNNASEFFDYLECRAYLPMIGMLLIIGSLLPKSVQSIKNKYFDTVAVVLVLVLAVISFIEVKDYKSPITFWEKAVETNPNRAVNLRQLGMEYQKFDRQDEAEKLFQRALSLNPQYEVDYLYVHLGLVYISRKDIAKAAEMFAMAAQISEKSTLARKNLANALFELGRQEEAIKPLKEMMELDPNDDFPISMLAKAYIKKSDYATALKYANKLNNPLRDESTTSIYAQWSSELFKNMNFSKAIEVLKEQIEQNPYDFQAFNNLGIAYVQLGRINEAEGCWTQAIKLNSKNLESYNNLLRLYYINKKDIKNAVKTAKQIIENGGKLDPAIQSALATYL